MNARMLFLLVVVTMVVSTGATAQTQVRWEASLEEALAKAKKEGKPLLISMHTSTEIACQRMLKTLYTDPDIIPILSEFVLLPTCFDEHAEVKKNIFGTEKSVSPLFGTLNCEQLMQNEADVRGTFLKKDDVKVPQHIFVGDDGEAFITRVYELKKPAFITLLNNALILYGSEAADGMDKVTKGFLKTAKKGPQKSKREAVKGILAFQDPRKLDILYLTIQSIRREKQKAECVRAFGKDIYTWAAPTVVKWLRDPSEFVRHCAVVSLEEMKASEAGESLLAMFPRARDKEFKKDILRALGPCSDGSAEIKKVLVKNVKDRREVNRIACYMSLGYYLNDKDVQELLARRFKAEGRSVAAKTAIIWAYTYAREPKLISQMHALVAKEKNHQLKYMANAAELQITTGTGVAPKDGKGGYVRLHAALGSLYSKDKIQRNAFKYWKGDD